MPTLPPLDRYPLETLATLAGLSVRTIRYYIAQGIVDPPMGEKRGAYYTRAHLERLLQIRRWTEAGASLERVKALIAGAPEDPARRSVTPGTVEVWSRVTVADGLEVQIEPGRADLSPEQVRQLVRGLTELYRGIRRQADAEARPDAPSKPIRTEDSDE